MTSFIAHPTIDCRNAYDLSEWWKQVLGWGDDPGDPNEPGHTECLIQSEDGVHKLLFIEVPEAKTVKNRLHLDLRPNEGLTRDQEVDRIAALGATVLADHRDHYGPGVGWVTMADPEGNEFCVCRSLAEMAAHRAAGV